ncbi:type III pantothenate kinase [Methylobacillus rhizosphaerae]|uniref:Type III pantothenate kinase n=1 Tax=Methylobacillus rhizosphaerae TaxID=551994 RepID=A0A239AJJ8_9PROT|nr:type III pantothenate kinase [Methylobacillus rhizosphaerae]SNR95846.1 type III pantothenate kinase [Methylobacillus rhizosphaerae]
MSRLLTIDMGNSRTKWGIFELDNGDIHAQGLLAGDGDIPESWQECTRVAIANVAGKEQQDVLGRRLEALGLPVRWHLSGLHACGLENAYTIPEQLGIDRWATMVASWQYYRDSCLVVNAGTALAINMIEHMTQTQGRFIGGIIVPGLRLMRSSIMGAAANIEMEHDGEYMSFPVNTRDAVHSGSLQAMCGAVNNMLQLLNERCGQRVPCILSGGDASALLPLLEEHGLAKEYRLEENLVLRGLLCLERAEMA